MTFTILNSEKEEDRKTEIQPDQGRNLQIDFNLRRGIIGRITRQIELKLENLEVTLILRVDIVSIRTLVLVRKIFVILLIMTMCLD